MKSALADDTLFLYLTNVAKENKFNVGLILGQQCSGKDYIIHFAKTPPVPSPDPEVSPKLINSLSDVNETWVADHARHATRMLPGGMNVLGIFIVTDEDVLNPIHQKIKSILLQTHEQLGGNKYLYGNHSSEKLIIHFNNKTQKHNCKSYDTSSGVVSLAECKFLPKATKWIQFECKYEMDEVYHILQEELEWPLKRHINVILEEVEKSLRQAIFLFDGESKDDEDTIENIGKRKKGLRQKSGPIELSDAEFKPVLVSIFQNCKPAIDEISTTNNLSQSFEVSQTGGQIKVIGHIACELWLNPKVSIKCAKQSVIHDIMRSLTARLEMHWDSLTEEEHSEDMNSIHEPPRRVLVVLPTTNVMLSDYLFPGEGPEDATTSLEEMLDIKITDKSLIWDVEGQAETSEYYGDTMDSESEETLPKIPDNNKFVYTIAVCVALLVLLLSLLIHFFYSKS